MLLPASNPKLGYHPTRDLTNIAYLAGTPIVISVARERRGTPARTEGAPAPAPA